MKGGGGALPMCEVHVTLITLGGNSKGYCGRRRQRHIVEIIHGARAVRAVLSAGGALGQGGVWGSRQVLGHEPILRELNCGERWRLPSTQRS